MFLDFEDKQSYESKLKDAIFEGSSKTISAVASGMGGVGKTCAIRGIVLLENARTRFSGGIYSMSLGAEAGKVALIRNLALFVRLSGGPKLSIAIENEEDLENVVSMVANWFSHFICLFIIDDIWCVKGLDKSVTNVLAGLAIHSRSRVAFTTRDSHLTSNIQIIFEKRDVGRSRKILLNCSGWTPSQQTEEEENAMKTLLEMSDGLPIAIGVIGSRARLYLGRRGISSSLVWTEVLKDYENSTSILDADFTRHNSEEKVLNVLLKSLKMLDDKNGGKQPSTLFACFAILQKRQEVPLSVVERIWGMTARETIDQLEEFERFSMLDVSHWFQGASRRCIVIHDLLLDVARYLAAKHTTSEVKLTAEVSMRVLDSYVTGHQSLSMVDAEIEPQPPTKKTFKSWFQGSAKRHMDANENTSDHKRARTTIDSNNRFTKHTEPSSSEQHAAKQTKAMQSSRERNVSTMEELCSKKKTDFHKSWVTLQDDGFAIRNAFRLLDMAGMHTGKASRCC